MLVIASTSPLNYLILIDAVELLPRLYGRIILPAAAWKEFKHPGAPEAVSVWANALPTWVEVRSASNPSGDAGLTALGDGEREAIAPQSRIEFRRRFCFCWTTKRHVDRRQLAALVRQELWAF